MTFRSRVLLPVAVGVASLLPSAAFAQQTPPPLAQPPHQAAFCGSTEMPMLTGDELAMPQPDTLGIHDEGTLDYSAVRGAIVHMEGNMVLLKLDNLGRGNAAPNHELAGDSWAVVRLPSECAPSDFKMGSPILAVGIPNGHGVLEAVEVAQAA
jgi:hypothetical protein